MNNSSFVIAVKRTLSVWLRRSQPADRWLAGFAAACAVLLAIEVTWEHPLRSNPALAASADRPATPPVQPNRDSASPRDYRPIVDRPLFTTDRRPYEPPVKSPPQPATPPAPRGPKIEFELSAVIQTPTAQIALLKVNRSPDVRKVSLGQAIDGWKLIKITSNAAVLRNGHETVTVSLRPDEAPAQKTFGGERASALHRRS